MTNNSDFPRPFQFVDKYYAGIRMIFTVLDSNNTVVWQSYQTEVDIPPLAKPVTLKLLAHHSWQKKIFVALEYDDLSTVAPGQYTVRAEVIGSPGYAATAPFNVSTIVGGPIIKPVALIK